MNLGHRCPVAAGAPSVQLQLRFACKPYYLQYKFIIYISWHFEMLYYYQNRSGIMM